MYTNNCLLYAHTCTVKDIYIYLPCSCYSNFLVINSLKWIKDTLKIWWDIMHVQSVFGHTYTHTHLHWMESSTWSSQSSCASSTYPLHISQSPSQGAELDPCHPSGGSGVCEESDCERCDLCFACGVDGCEWGRAWSRDRERWRREMMSGNVQVHPSSVPLQSLSNIHSAQIFSSKFYSQKLSWTYMSV